SYHLLGRFGTAEKCQLVRGEPPNVPAHRANLHAESAGALRDGATEPRAWHLDEFEAPACRPHLVGQRHRHQDLDTREARDDSGLVRHNDVAGDRGISPYRAVEACGERTDNPDLQHDWSPSGGRSRMLKGSRLRLNSLRGNWLQKLATVSSAL